MPIPHNQKATEQQIQDLIDLLGPKLLLNVVATRLFDEALKIAKYDASRARHLHQIGEAIQDLVDENL